MRKKYGKLSVKFFFVFFAMIIWIGQLNITPAYCEQYEILEGNWIGFLNNDVSVYYKISKNWDGTLKASNGIIEMGISGSPVEKVYLKNDLVHLEEIESKALFEGKIDRDNLIIDGNYSNLSINKSWPLVLKKVDELSLPARPQTPKKPYGYLEETVVYDNKSARIKIAGTLTVPNSGGPFPAVLLISGSGRQDRDCDSSFHRRFLVLADHLTRNGIAVLRVDDRGVGGTTCHGSYWESTTADFAGDVVAGVEYLKTRNDIDKKQIGLIGHSEGGLVAPMVASQSSDIAFIVIMAGPYGGNMLEAMIEQDAREAMVNGANENEATIIKNWSRRFYSIALNEKDNTATLKKMQELYEQRTPEEKQAFEKGKIHGGSLDTQTAFSPWFRYFLTIDTDIYLKKVKCPVLALYGENDIQAYSKDNTVKDLGKAFTAGGNNQYTIKILPNLNHRFQTCESGNIPSYKIEETISPVVMELITSWIKNQNKK